MTNLLLSRARLRRDVPAAALWHELAPDDDDRRMQASHRLVWTLFADAADRTRDFLWREADPGTFFLLSNRAPEDRHNLFEIDPPKEFAPQLRAGDALRFSLRANATVARKPQSATGERTRGKPSDVVMDALYRLPKGRERAEARRDAISAAGHAWLSARGAKNGFRLLEVDAQSGASVSCVTGYRVMRLDDRNERMHIGILDYDGVLVVEDPSRFTDAIAQGFGRAKAFGCGLMLVRRAW
jgi:CRISPR system Cascade subunit CasE